MAHFTAFFSIFTPENLKDFVLGIFWGFLLGLIFVRFLFKHKTESDILCFYAYEKDKSSVFYDKITRNGVFIKLKCNECDKKGFCKKLNRPCEVKNKIEKRFFVF